MPLFLLPWLAGGAVASLGLFGAGKAAEGGADLIDSAVKLAAVGIAGVLVLNYIKK